MQSRIDCAQACKACHEVCSREVSRLMDRSVPTVLDDEAIEALIQCAAMCQTATKLLYGNKGFADAIRMTCASNCERCAESLGRYEEMRDCVEAALRCAASCREI